MLLERWHEGCKDSSIIDDGIRIKKLFDVNIDEYRQVYLEMQNIKQQIDNLYFKVAKNNIVYTDDEIEIIVNQTHRYHSLYWSGFSLLNIMGEELLEKYNNEVTEIINKAKKMSYSIEGGLAYIIDYLSGTDISTINREYKIGIDF